MTAHSEYRLPHSSDYTIISKSQRTVNVPFCVIPEYKLGERETPTFQKVHEDAQSMLIALKDGAGRIAHKLDLAYVLSKMAHAADENPLRGWTGLNTMLCQEIPAVQRVGYLPVINGSPTEYSTIREILVRSKGIVEKLQLKHAVLVFDEEVYCKIQGEFHSIMSFLSAISKIFEDGGLKVV